MTALKKVTRIALRRESEQGKPGERGAIARPRKFVAGEEYLSGASGEEYIDYAYYNGVFYRCLITHVAAETETPFKEVQNESGLWQVEQHMDFLSVRSLIIGEDGSGWILEDGYIRHTSGKVTLGADGSANYNDKCIITADGVIKAAEGEFNGKVSIANGKILLETDGSGQLAGGAITWDDDGNGEVSGAWLTPMGSTTNALNKTVYVSNGLTSMMPVTLGSYDSSGLSSSNPIRRLGTVTIISTNTTTPSYIYVSAKIVMPRIKSTTGKAISSMESTYNYLVIAPGSSVTFDVYDDYNKGARCVRSKSPLGWFNVNGSIYPCTYDGADYEDLQNITTYNNAIGSSISGGTGYSVISLPAGLVKYMKLRVDGDLSYSNDSSIYFQRTDSSGTVTTTYTVAKLQTETSIISGNNVDYRNGGKFGFGIYYSGSYTIDESPDLLVKLYDAGSMIAYFEIQL